jgi:hypothetical protein
VKLSEWIVKRSSWRNNCHNVTINGVKYYPEWAVDRLFTERQQLVSKWKKERAKRRLKDATMQLTPTELMNKNNQCNPA